MNEYQIVKLKQAKNIFWKIITDSKSIFYAADKINKNLFNKAENLFYLKDKVFIKLYSDLEDKDKLYTDGNKEILDCFLHLLFNRKKYKSFNTIQH